MTASQPMTKAQKFCDEHVAMFVDGDLDVPPLVARRVLRDAQKLMDSATGHDCSRLWSLIGMVESRLDHTERSLDAHLNAWRYSPHLVGLALNVTRAMLFAGRVTEAQTYFERAEALGHKRSDNLFLWAEICHGLEMPNEATRALLGLLEHASASSSLRGLAALAFTLGHTSVAADLLARHVSATLDLPLGSTPSREFLQAHAAAMPDDARGPRYEEVLRAVLAPVSPSAAGEHAAPSSLAEDYRRGELSVHEFARRAGLDVPDALVWLERHGVLRAAEAIRLSPAAREERLALLRLRRLARGGVPARDPERLRRSVIASQRIEDIDARAHLREPTRESP